MEQTSPPTFGFVHSFYAIMGGFAFLPSYDDDTSTLKKPLFALPLQIDPYKPVHVPNFKGLIYIMKHFPHLITNIPEEVILDRAQSNGLSKALLIVQVGWFCTNCASRLIQDLPLSLLEVSTAAHAFCTLITYFVWWSKPLNVPTPIIIVGNEAQEVHALLGCSSKHYDEALEIAWRRAAGDSSVQTEGKPKDIILAANVLERLLRTGQTPEKPPPDYNLSIHLDSFPGSELNHSREDPLYEWIITAVAPLIYGLVHLLAWNDHFPTTLESRLWRVSSVVVTFSGLVGVPLAALGGYLDNWRSRLQWNSHFATLDIAIPLAVLLLCVVALAHMLSSGFLIVESIRQLHFLDPAAYQLPSWSNYWPHLT